MTDEAMSPLRRRMIEDMTIRKVAPKTQHDYVQRIKNFAVFLGRSPETASFEDVRRYQLHLAGSGVGVPTLNQNVATLRFFFRVTLTLFRILRHGASGHVNLRARINAIFDLLSKGQSTGGAELVFLGGHRANFPLHRPHHHQQPVAGRAAGEQQPVGLADRHRGCRRRLDLRQPGLHRRQSAAGWRRRVRALLPVTVRQRTVGRLPVHRDRQYRPHDRLQRDVEF
jgi:hypothetical protein